MVERRATCAGCHPGILGEAAIPKAPRKGEGQLDPFQLGGAPQGLQVGADLRLRPANSRIGKLHPVGRSYFAIRERIVVITAERSTANVENLVLKPLTFDSPENPSVGRV
jgi:hypothetical protein